MLAIIVGGYSLVDLAIFIVVICAVIALVYIALKQFGVPIPAWFSQALMVVVVAFVIIILIRLVAGM